MLVHNKPNKRANHGGSQKYCIYSNELVENISRQHVLVAHLGAAMFQYVHSLPEVSSTELTIDSFIGNFTSYVT